MIPRAIDREHVLAALDAIDRDGVPPGRESRRFHLLRAGRRYPPKLVVSMACQEATARLLPSNRFSGGAETNGFLAVLGFEIVGTSGDRLVVGKERGRWTPRRRLARLSPEDLVRALAERAPLHGWREVRAGKAIPPNRAGVYAWFFWKIPPGVPSDGCVKRDGWTLLYVGISPGSGTSGETLRSRIRYHYSGNAEGSTLRLTLGCLLEAELGTVLRRVGSSGKRMAFGPREKALSEWMEQNARVAWVEVDHPWTAERAIFQHVRLPLNIDANAHHPFCPRLREVRRHAKAHARALAVKSDW